MSLPGGLCGAGQEGDLDVLSDVLTTATRRVDLFSDDEFLKLREVWPTQTALLAAPRKLARRLMEGKAAPRPAFATALDAVDDGLLCAAFEASPATRPQLEAIRKQRPCSGRCSPWRKERVSL